MGWSLFGLAADDLSGGELFDECGFGLIRRHACGCDPFGHLLCVAGVGASGGDVGDEVGHGSLVVAVARASRSETSGAPRGDGAGGGVMSEMRRVAPDGR